MKRFYTNNYCCKDLTDYRCDRGSRNSQSGEKANAEDQKPVQKNVC